MKTGAIIFAILILTLTCFGLPNGKQHNGINVMGGKITYSDGSTGYSIVSITEKKGKIIINEMPFKKSVNMALLSKTLNNQDGFTPAQIKEYGFAIDQKSRRITIEGNLLTIEPAFADPITWEFSQKLTDAVKLFTPEKIKEKQIEAKKQVKKTEKKLKKKSETLLEKLAAKKVIFNWAKKQ